MKTKVNYLIVSFTLSLGMFLILLWLSDRVEPGVTRAQGEDGYHVYYVAPGGDCGGAEPCHSNIQSAVDSADDPDDMIKVAVGTYTGVSVRPRDDITTTGVVTQVVYISKTVTIRGGYTTVDWMTSDPGANPTTLNIGGQGRGLYITGDITPTIEGLYITGGDATGMGGDPYLDKDAGGGMYIVTATAVISGNRVFGNTAQRGGGLYLHTSDAKVRGNEIFSNSADDELDGGGGVYLWDSDATLVDNIVSSNVAHSGGGLYLRSSNATLNDNEIIANVAGWRGGGLTIAGDGIPLITNNVFFSNRADDRGGGLYLFSSDARLNSNILTLNTAPIGGGLCLWSSEATVERNTFSTNAAERGGGLSLECSDARLVNNLVVKNRSDVLGSGVYIAGSMPQLLHSTIAHNSGGDGSGVYVDTYTTVSETVLHSDLVLTNTILVSHTTGISITGSNTVTLNGVLWHDTPITASRSITATVVVLNQYEGDPAFVDPDGGDYHLSPGSAALSKGVDAGVYEDIDGDPRPVKGCDLGADELSVVYLPIVGRLFPAIQPIGHVDVPQLAKDIDVTGGYAYVAMCQDRTIYNPYSKVGGLQIIDFSDPASPVKRGSYIDSYCLGKVAVAGDYAYGVLFGRVGGILWIIDISDPTQPWVAAAWPSASEEPGPYVRDVVVSGEYAYVKFGHHNLIALDISNPLNPTVTGEYSCDEYWGGMLVDEDWMCLVTEGGLRILDIATMSEIGFYFYDVPATLDGVAMQGQYVYVTSGNGDLYVVDVSDPANPTEVGSCTVEGGGSSLVVVDEYAYLSNGNVVSVADPMHPRVVAFYADKYDSYTSIATDGNYVYHAAGTLSWTDDGIFVADSAVSVFELFGTTTGDPDTR